MAKPRKEKKPPVQGGRDEIVLSGDLLHASLSDVARTVDGASYAFVRLSGVGKGITVLPEVLSTYVHLRYIDLSNNEIQNIAPLLDLPHVLSLNLARNNISDISALAAETCLPSCVVLNLSSNSIRSLNSLRPPRLVKLILDGNLFESFEGVEYLPETLEHLSLKNSQLKSLAELPAIPNLTHLSVAQCPISSLVEVCGLTSLRSLDAADVQLADCSTLKVLLLLPELKELNVAPPDSQMEKEGFRLEVLTILPRLTRLNCADISVQEKAKAKQLKLKRKKEQQQQQQPDHSQAVQEGEEESQEETTMEEK